MSLSGLKVAVRYSLPPCQLGFCGPLDQSSRKILIDFASGGSMPERAVRDILERFEAMYPYLRLIAASNDISDLFDERVVKALWVGNELLDNVDVEDIHRVITTDFAKPGLLSKEEAEGRAAQIPEGAVPHHSFHVFILGPIAGRVELAGAMKDLCRISWGRVMEIKYQRSNIKIREQRLKVRYKPLVSNGKMRLGEEIEREIEWDGKIVSGVKKGDWVSFHWGQVCDVLSEGDVDNLEHYTEQTLRLL